MSYLIQTFILLAITCHTQREDSGKDKEYSKPESILVVYLSRTENTKAVAEMIQKKAGGDLVDLKLKNPYPENYQEIVAQVDRENEEGYLPALKTEIENLKRYDTVFVGFPTWDMQLPPPIKSFLTDHDLAGKTVIPFNTNAGYGLGQSLQQLRNLCPDSKVLKEFSVEGGYEKQGVLLAIKGERKQKVSAQVEEWLKSIKILK